jgi:hypothetical protein
MCQSRSKSPLFPVRCHMKTLSKILIVTNILLRKTKPTVTVASELLVASKIEKENKCLNLYLRIIDSCNTCIIMSPFSLSTCRMSSMSTSIMKIRNHCICNRFLRCFICWNWWCRDYIDWF